MQKKKIIIIPKFTDKNGMNCVHLREWLSIIILSEINAGWLVRIVWKKILTKPMFYIKMYNNKKERDFNLGLTITLKCITWKQILLQLCKSRK